MADVVESVTSTKTSKSSASDIQTVYSTMTISIAIRELGVVMYTSNKTTNLVRHFCRSQFFFNSNVIDE